MCLYRRLLSGRIQCRSIGPCGNAARSSSVLLASRSLSHLHCHRHRARARAGKPTSRGVSVEVPPFRHSSDWTVAKGEPIYKTTSASVNPSARIAPPTPEESTAPRGRIPGYSIKERKTHVSSWGTLTLPKYVSWHIDTVEFGQLQLAEEHVTCRSEHEVIASFNHVGMSGAIPRKIFVPGGPAVYQNQDLPKVLTRKDFNIDVGSPFLSPSQFHKPMLQAIKYMRPDFYFDDIDVLSGVAPLMALLDFCRGTGQKKVLLNATVIHDTLILDHFRYPNTAGIKGFLSTMHRQESLSHNFGMRFEEDFTKWPAGLEHSRNHTRMLQYRLGNLNCVVPVGVDACYGAASEKVKSTLPEGQHLVNHHLGSDIAILPQGAVNHSPTIEIKAGVVYHYDWQQMWFSRTKMLLRANIFKIGVGALVDMVHMSETADSLIDWENAEQIPLRRLVMLLRRIREIVQESKFRHCFLMRLTTPEAPLEIFDLGHNDFPVHDYIVPSFWRAGRRDTSSSSPSDPKVGSKP